jgi:hypothetical protein
MKSHRQAAFLPKTSSTINLYLRATRMKSSDDRALGRESWGGFLDVPNFISETTRSVRRGRLIAAPVSGASARSKHRAAARSRGLNHGTLNYVIRSTLHDTPRTSRCCADRSPCQLAARSRRGKGLAMVYALRGMGKTLFALGIGFAAATGTKFLKWPAPKSRRVLLIDGEIPAAALQERLARLIESAPETQLTPQNLKIRRTFRMSWSRGWRKSI